MEMAGPWVTNRTQRERAGPLSPRSRKAFPGCAEAEEEEGDAAQAELSRVVSINLGLARDCVMPC